MKKSLYSLASIISLVMSSHSHAMKTDTTEDLSNCVLVNVASFLTDPQDNSALSLVSKRFNKIANNQTVLDGLIFSEKAWKNFSRRAKEKVDSRQEYEWKNLPKVALEILSAYANERDNVALQVTQSRALHVEKFLDLPDFALLNIFSYLDLSNLSTVAQVSTRMRDISEDNSLWTLWRKQALEEYTLDYDKDVQLWKKLHVLRFTLQRDLQASQFNMSLFVNSFNEGGAITKESGFYHYINGFVFEMIGDSDNATKEYEFAEEKGSIKAQEKISQSIEYGWLVHENKSQEERYKLLLEREQKGDPYASDFISHRIHRGTEPFNTLSKDERKKTLEERASAGNTKSRELLQRGFGPPSTALRHIGRLTKITDPKVLQETLVKAAKGDKKAQRDVLHSIDDQEKKENLRQGYPILNLLFTKRSS